jgi:hypothetical protein
VSADEKDQDGELALPGVAGEESIDAAAGGVVSRT